MLVNGLVVVGWYVLISLVFCLAWSLLLIWAKGLRRPETMKALSLRQAGKCEHAKKPRCRCRCGGVLHGAARVERVEELPFGDPHQPARQAEVPGTEVR